MPGALAALGMQAATNATNGAIGGIMGQLFANANDKRQLRQQEKLQALQISGNKEMTDYEFMKQMEMWKATNYPGQMEMLKAAGLNPSLLYGKGGGGGVTTGSGHGNVTGATAASNASEAMAGMGMMMQNSRTAAEIELIKAQTEKAKAETTKTATVDTELTKTQTASLTQGIENQKSVKVLTDAQAALTQLETKWQESSWKTREKILVVESQKMVEEFDALARNNMIESTVATERIEMVQNQAIQIMLQNEAIRTGIQLDQARIIEIAQSIRTQVKQLQQGDRQLDQKDKELLIQEIRNDLIETGIWVGAASNIAGTAVDIFTKGKGGKSFTTNNNIYTRPVVEKKSP